MLVACAQLQARTVGEAPQALEDITRALMAAASRNAQLVVLPECSYPGYVLLGPDPYRRRIPSAAQALERIATTAKAACIAVALGIARAGADGRLYNQAVYIDRQGIELAHHAKVHLWNFDRKWFARGSVVKAFDTEFGRLGLMICADGRMPEIPRGLAAQGAWLILDPTAWVSSGRAYASMRNPQLEFSLCVRAMENGVWIAAADKCGSELSAVHYVGRSLIVAPTGETVALAPADGPAIIIAEAAGPGPRLIRVSLKPHQSRALTHTPRSSKLKSSARAVRIGVFQGPALPSKSWLGARRALEAQGVAAIVNTAASAAGIERSLRHARGLRHAIVSGRNMLAPEAARAAALSGADMLVWTRPPRHPHLLAFARTRAFENKVFVLLCARSDGEEPACAIAPDGSVFASAIARQPSGFVAEVEPMQAREKQIVPGTEVFSDRLPARAYAGSS